MGLNGDEKFSAKLVLHRGGSARDICSSDLLSLKDRVCWDPGPAETQGEQNLGGASPSETRLCRAVAEKLVIGGCGWQAGSG